MEDVLRGLNPHEFFDRGRQGVQGLWHFPNGFSVSVVYGPYSHGLEAALIREGDLCYNTQPPAGLDYQRSRHPFYEDVEGYLETEELLKILEVVRGWERDHPVRRTRY